MFAKIDTIKVKLPAEICDLNLRRFDRKETVKNSGTTFTTFDLVNVVDGLKQIQYSPITEKVILEFSAKILRKHYYDLLSLDTLEHAVKVINSTGAICLDTDNFTHSADVLKIDFCTNIKVGKDLQDYLNFLACVNAPNYRTDIYKKHAVIQSIIYKSVSKTAKNRLICYNKFAELSNKNAKFDGLKLEQFAGVLRVERNLTDLKSIRKITGKTNSLVDCLTVETLPNVELLNEIIMSKKHKTFTNSGAKFILHNFGYECLLKEYDNDMHQIYELLKQNMNRQSAYRQIIEIRQYVKQRKAVNEVAKNLTNILADLTQNH